MALATSLTALALAFAFASSPSASPETKHMWIGATPEYELIVLSMSGTVCQFL